MKLDLSECEIRTPTGDDLADLYGMLIDVFPVDRPVFTEMIETGKSFYTWTPYALYRRGELLGNVSLVPLRIWLSGQPTEVAGIASVGTRKEHRRKGVAQHLMRHALAIVDEWKMPAVLFTDLPKLYEGLGFHSIEQTYPSAPVGRMEFAAEGFQCEVVDTLDQGRLDQMARVHADAYPNYDGKVVRDPDYWQLYQMLFNPFPKPKMLFLTDPRRIVGFARCEVEDDRLLVAELCAPANPTRVSESLLGFARDYACQLHRDSITLALPPDHFALETLRRLIPLEPERPGAHRETFMVRPPAGEPLGPLDRLHWSLADKF